ncbi:MAG: hypothetical protein KKA73_26320 [Chloroflexi bacterium]|nr:hypothetical protein [Chloroflexota bacterium]MBU1751215.1 hypothetical protein [Chloroflexota bacterium]
MTSDIQRVICEGSLILCYRPDAVNATPWTQAVESRFDRPLFYDLSYVQPVVDHYCAADTPSLWLKDATGAIANYRFAHYAAQQIRDLHHQAWSVGRDPPATAVDFFLSSFVVMCQTALYALTLWLNAHLELDIRPIEEVDLARPAFQRGLQIRCRPLYIHVLALRPWLQSLGRYYRRVLHRDPQTGGASLLAPGHIAAGQFLCVISASGQAQGIPIPVDRFCETYLRNADRLLRVGFDEGYRRLRPADKQFREG